MTSSVTCPDLSDTIDTYVLSINNIQKFFLKMSYLLANAITIHRMRKVTSYDIVKDINPFLFKLMTDFL